MNLLAIDTSTDFGSVAASRGEALFSRHERAGQRQAEMILGMVDEVLAEARIELAQIHGIAYGQGPGSFTGLRIAAGVTQGLALARGIGVIGVGWLRAVSEEGVNADERGTATCPQPRADERGRSSRIDRDRGGPLRISLDAREFPRLDARGIRMLGVPRRHEAHRLRGAYARSRRSPSPQFERRRPRAAPRPWAQPARARRGDREGA